MPHRRLPELRLPKLVLVLVAPLCFPVRQHIDGAHVRVAVELAASFEVGLHRRGQADGLARQNEGVDAVCATAMALLHAG